VREEEDSFLPQFRGVNCGARRFTKRLCGRKIRMH